MRTQPRTTNFDNLAGAIPDSRTAAQVVGSGTHYEPVVHYGTMPHWENCPPLKKPEDMTIKGRAMLSSFVGFRLGRLCVVGVLLDKRDDHRAAQWVVRCDCGHYEIRKHKALRSGKSVPFCVECRHFDRARRTYNQQGGHPIEHFAGKAYNK